MTSQENSPDRMTPQGNNPDQTTSEDSNPSGQIDLEMRKLELERYKARLDYRKFVLASVFAAIVIAAIPPLFQLATAFLENVKSQAKLDADTQSKSAERAVSQENFHDTYIKEVLKNALNQDIEYRIRLADYFSHVTTGTFQKGWQDFFTELTGNRNVIRAKIDDLERQWHQKSLTATPGSVELDELKRHLDWAYNEVAYIEPNRPVTTNPRSPEYEGFYFFQDKLSLGSYGSASIDPNKIILIHGPYEHDLGHNTYVVGATPRPLVTEESPEALVDRLGVNPPLAKFTAPNSTPVWIKATAIENVRAALPFEQPEKPSKLVANTVLIMANMHQVIQEDLPTAKRIITEHGGDIRKPITPQANTGQSAPCTKASRSEIAKRVQDIIIEHLGVDKSKVTDNARFVQDLGADSLDKVELDLAFEEEFKHEIPDDEAAKMGTVKDAVEFLVKSSVCTNA